MANIIKNPSELSDAITDVAVIDGNVDILLARLTDTRATYLDNLNNGVVTDKLSFVSEGAKQAPSNVSIFTGSGVVFYYPHQTPISQYMDFEVDGATTVSICGSIAPLVGMIPFNSCISMKFWYLRFNLYRYV